MYFAEASAPRLNSAVNGGNGTGVGNMFDLQSVQVLKGPQGTLFGRNTTGGAILLVPQKPTDKFEGYVEGTLGDFNAHRVEAVINVPLNDMFRLRLGTDINRRDGYINNRSGVGPTDFNNVHYVALRGSLIAQLTPELENYTIVTYARSDTNGVTGKLAVCNSGAKGGAREGVNALLRAVNCAQLVAETAAGYGYYDVQNSVPNPFIRTMNWQAINTTTFKASEALTIKNIFSYGKSREAYSFNLFGDNGPTPFVVPYPGLRGPQGYQSTLSEELQFQGKFGSQFNWQAGAYVEVSDPAGAGQEQYSASLATCTNVYAFQCVPLKAANGSTTGAISVARNNFWFRNKGLFAQATYRLTEQLAVTAGIRNTWDSARQIGTGFATGNGTTTGAAISPTGLVGGPTVPAGQPVLPGQFRCSQATSPGATRQGGLILSDQIDRQNLATNDACFRQFVQSSSRPTWLIDLEYKPISDVMGYIKYARGYRGGGVNQSTVGSEIWQPEKVDLYELGLKMTWHGEINGTFAFAAFYNNFTNQQVNLSVNQCQSSTICTNPAPVGVSGIQNVGKSRIKGIEADATVRFFDDSLRFDVGYAYLNAKVIATTLPPCDTTRYDCVNITYLQAGDRLYLTPKNRVSVTATYTLPLDESIGKISVGATLTHTDSQFINHTDDNAFAIGAIPFNPSLLPASDLLNLNLNWKDVGGMPVDFALFASNVTNLKYFNASTNGLSNTGADFILVAPPRMFGGRVKLRFGN